MSLLVFGSYLTSVNRKAEHDCSFFATPPHTPLCTPLDASDQACHLQLTIKYCQNVILSVLVKNSFVVCTLYQSPKKATNAQLKNSHQGFISLYYTPFYFVEDCQLIVCRYIIF